MRANEEEGSSIRCLDRFNNRAQVLQAARTVVHVATAGTDAGWNTEAMSIPYINFVFAELTRRHS